MIIHLSFGNSYILLYLLAIPLLIVTHFILLEKAKQKALRFANFEAIKRVTGEKPLTKNILILVLRIIALTSLIIAASQPVLWYKTKLIDGNLVFAIDSSASMSTEDFYPNRLGAAKIIAERIIKNLKAYSKIGVISFSGVTYINTYPTTSKDKAIDSINSIDIIEAGGTDIPGAIITGVNLMKEEEGKTIILISDGSNTISYLLRDPVEKAIDYAKKNNVIVYTIGIGREGSIVGYLPKYYNIPARFDEEVMKRIANETGGKYYRINNSEDYNRVVQDLLDSSREGFVKRDLTYPLLFIALISFFIEWGLISTRFKRIP